MDWIQQTHDSDQWQAITNIVLKLQDPQKCGTFLTYFLKASIPWCWLTMGKIKKNYLNTLTFTVEQKQVIDNYLIKFNLKHIFLFY